MTQMDADGRGSRPGGPLAFNRDGQDLQDKQQSVSPQRTQRAQR